MGIGVLQYVVPVLLVVGLTSAVEVGYCLGKRRVRASDTAKGIETGAIQGAMLGLLGLLLGFSFAGAAGRFMERQDLITAEANAIGTAYLRAELLTDPYASDLRGALEAYVEHRIELSKSLQTGLSRDQAEQIRAYHTLIWNAAAAGVNERPAAMMPVLGPVNEVIDLHATRVAASEKHLPALVIGLLVVCSVLTLGVIGYACSLARARNSSMTLMIAILIAAALWTTLDLDRPRIGLIRLSDRAFETLGLGVEP